MRPPSTAPDDGSLLLVTHVSIRNGPHGPQIDDQTAAGIEQWRRHFSRVTYYGVADEQSGDTNSSAAWVDMTDEALGGQARVLAFPRGYSLNGMIRHHAHVRLALRSEMRRHQHLCYTIGGLVGDWPALAAIESIAQGRRYAAWIDRVEPPIIRNRLARSSVIKRLVAEVAIPLMEQYTRHVLRHSEVALLQGMDTFQHYGSWASNPHCTYDIHTHVGDEISDKALAMKRSRILLGAPLKILYVGRAAAMKGPADWLSVLEDLHRDQIPFEAAWVGDGPELQTMKDRAAKSALGLMVDLPGFVGDRQTLLRWMRDSDLLLFCHKTPESPRCLIESLVSGCPIVGYEAAYPKGLTEQRGGGLFVKQDNISALCASVRALHYDRQALVGLMADAAASGHLYNEDAVYAHRAGLMRQG